jgi:hypothetical protein
MTKVLNVNVTGGTALVAQQALQYSALDHCATREAYFCLLLMSLKRKVI